METYIRVAGTWTYLYRAVDSAGDTIDFLLSPYRVINVDGHPAYPSVTNELRRTGQLGPRCRCRPSPYLNNRIEQDHRFVKKRVVASQWFRSVNGALRTITGYEAMNMIRKGQIRWLAKHDTVGQVRSSSRRSASLLNPYVDR